MNRNSESHFSQVPRANIQRSMFDRSFSHKTTFNAGDVIPIFLDEVLPGDTWSVSTSKIIRMQTLLAPVYDNMYLDTYFFFIPTRLTYKHWEEFMGENKTSAWTPDVNYPMPCITSPNGGFERGTLADYFGLPVGVEWYAGELNAPIALPFRAYALCMDHFFRDQNLSDPLLIPDGEADQQGSNGSNYVTDVANGGKPFKAAKYHDRFTSALPQPQKGPPVNVPVFRDSIPVKTGDPFSFETAQPMSWTALRKSGDVFLPRGSTYPMQEDTSQLGFGNPITNRTADPSQNYFYFAPNNLYADVGSVGFNIEQLRLAAVTQMYYESLARGGSRYDEQIAQFFGVTSPDSRLQHPEYLGGNRIAVNVHEVVNNAQSEQDFLGDLGAMSATTDTHKDFTYSATEHGYLLGVTVVRYDHSYMQGINKMWLRKDKFDFYNPIFANIGEQPIRDVELYANGAVDSDSVFGYQEAWSEYRYATNRATSYMRPNINQAFAHWSLTDNYTSKPFLSDAWIREDKSNVDRALAVTSSVSDQFFADFYFDCKVVRPMPMYSIPGVIGRF